MNQPWNPHYPKASEPRPLHIDGIYMVRVPSWGEVAYIVDCFGNLQEFTLQTADHYVRTLEPTTH